jgi:hypothetical protein
MLTGARLLFSKGDRVAKADRCFWRLGGVRMTRRNGMGKPSLGEASVTD